MYTVHCVGAIFIQANVAIKLLVGAAMFDLFKDRILCYRFVQLQSGSTTLCEIISWRIIFVFALSSPGKLSWLFY